MKELKELIEYMAAPLVDHPEEIRVDEVEKDDVIIYRLSVSKEDLGKVIGKQGRVVQAIRSMVKAAAWKEKKRVWVEIMNT